jgi:hypothetical protein
VYSLGEAPATYNELINRIRSTVEELKSKRSLEVFYKDEEREEVIVTTDQALLEAYGQYETLIIEVRTARATRTVQ